MEKEKFQLNQINFFELNFQLNYDNKIIGNQKNTIDFNT